MQPTIYPHVNTFVDSLLTRMQAVLGGKLVGLFLYGSLVMGDYDDASSDIDLLAAVADQLNEAEFATLNAMQDELIAQNPQWMNRLEIAYLSLDALRTFKTRESRIAVDN